MEAALVQITPTLDDLAADVNREHGLCLAAALSSLQHALRAGEALLAAKKLVPRGQWEPWLDENCPAVAVMSRPYMRIASYQEMLPPDVTTAIEAQRHLRGLPAFDGTGPARHPPEVREEALRLVGEGVSQRMVASILDIDRKCVRRWVNPNGERRDGNYRRGRPTRAEQAERERIVRREKRAIGPAALANGFRAVVEANREGDRVALGALLRDLASTAVGWAEQLEARRG